MVHLAVSTPLIQNELDLSLLNGRKELLVCSWVYHVSLSCMARHLHLGIEIDLYYPVELPSIFFYLDYLYGILEKNAMYFFKNFDRNYVTGIPAAIQPSTRSR